MKGHENLIERRLRGEPPRIVFVDTEGLNFSDHPWFLDQPTVWIEPDDNLARLDLRCVVELILSVTGTSEERVESVKDAVLKAGAERVITAVFEDPKVVTNPYPCPLRKHTDIHRGEVEGYEWPTT